MAAPELSLPNFWLCADLSALAAAPLAERLEAVLQRVEATVWLRLPAEVDARDVLHLGERVKAARAGALLVGDRVDLALALDARGVHLSEQGPRPAEVRRLAASLKRTLWMSASVHDAGGVTERATQVDALVLSPFGEVPGKGPALGEGAFAGLRARAPGRPVLALGGVRTAEDVRRAVRAGASGVVVRRALLGEDPVSACAELAAALRG